jgi:cation diffusion facilitator CzcD-associated flavoprotein CzcO
MIRGTRFFWRTIPGKYNIFDSPEEKMNILIVGASGATGRLLVEQLLERGQSVKVIVRSPDKLPASIRQHEQLTVIQASVLDLSDAQLAEHVKGCAAVAVCLGHTMNLQGIFGHPRRLVTEATRRLCAAIKANTPATPTKFLLMNTVGNRNRDLHEPISFAQQCVIGVIRLLLPPHADNEQAADYLRTQIGRNDGPIEWVAVRPDALLDADAVSAYEVHPSPLRSAIFDPGKTSRINVGHFMAELITNNETWQKWQGQMPVIYNRAKSSGNR